MKSDNKQTLLKANNASYKTVEGVTYFKLKSEFDGDYTKNCGLLGEEIDKNFYFLRGYDIETVYVDEDRNLVINRVDKDYEPIKVKIGEDLGKDSFTFDKENGTITVTYPDGTTSQMDGFLVEGKDIRIATDNTFDGNGTIFNPLRLTGVEKTGTYSSAEEYFDLTENITMPNGKGKGYRIVTKEKIDNFGCLYPLNAVKTIQDKLTETKSQWRVPSKKDWDELLNAMEIDPEYRNHDSLSNKWLGQIAGSALKSHNLWKKYDNLSTEHPTDGQDVVGLSILPLGIGPDRNEILDDANSDVEGYSKLSGMWTSTFDGSDNAYVKIFGYNSSQVDQDTYGLGAKLSIRLVKDYNYDNYNEIESILGLPYPTVLVYGICDNAQYVKIWTQINVYNSDPQLGGVRSEEWINATDSDKGVKIVYFINEWDGHEWHKKVMNDGDSVVIKNYNKIKYHEWRIINGVLVDTLEQINTEFGETLEDLNNQIASLKNNIEKEISDRTAQDELLQNQIKEEISARTAQDGLLQNQIEEETKNRQEEDGKLLEKIDIEISNRLGADEALLTKIDNEIKAREEAVDAEATVRKEADDALESKINDETTAREEADKLEKVEREEADSTLDGKIKDETEAREKADEAEAKARKEADIIPGEYILDGANNTEMIIPTHGDNVEDIKVKLSDNFFNFGPILNE